MIVIPDAIHIVLRIIRKTLEGQGYSYGMIHHILNIARWAMLGCYEPVEYGEFSANKVWVPDRD